MAGAEALRRELLAAVAAPADSRRQLEAWLDDAGPMPAAGTLAQFARALNDSAEANAAREAQLAGHLAVFNALRHWLLTDPTPEQLATLAEPLGVSPATLRLSLERLRQRVRQRIDSSMALWAPDDERRHNLRQRLRAALTREQGQP